MTACRCCQPISSKAVRCPHCLSLIHISLYGEGGLWVRPAAMWLETVTRDGVTPVSYTQLWVSA